jgi:hypothetical protein
VELSKVPVIAVAIARDGIESNGAPGSLGAPELRTIARNPPSISQLHGEGSIMVMPLA